MLVSLWLQTDLLRGRGVCGVVGVVAFQGSCSREGSSCELSQPSPSSCGMGVPVGNKDLGVVSAAPTMVLHTCPV